jgi:hypothetical protein
MQRPRRVRNVALAVAVLGLAAVAAGLAGRSAMGRLTREAMWVGGGIFAAAAFAIAGYAQVLVARRDRLARGDGVLARWSVGAREWRTFVTLNEELNREEPGIAWQDRGGEGIDVVIGRDGMIVGDDYFILRLGNFYEASADFVQGPPGRLDVRVTGHGESASRMTLLRVPVAAGNEQDARAACRKLDADAAG